MLNWLTNLKFQFGFIESGNNYTESLMDFYNFLIILFLNVNFFIRSKNLLTPGGKSNINYVSLLDNTKSELNNNKLKIFYSIKNKRQLLDNVGELKKNNPEIVNNSILFSRLYYFQNNINNLTISEKKELTNIFHQISNRPILSYEFIDSTKLLIPISSTPVNQQLFNLAETKSNINIGPSIQGRVNIYLRYPIMMSNEVGKMLEDTAQNIYIINDGVVENGNIDNSLSQHIVTSVSNRGNVINLNENNIIECLKNLKLNMIYFDDNRFNSSFKNNNLESIENSTINLIFKNDLD